MKNGRKNLHCVETRLEDSLETVVAFRNFVSREKTNL